MLVIDKYLKSVINSEDKIILNEVDKCVNSSAYRSAYIMVWIACAESLKRRFKHAGRFDNEAGKVVTKTGNMEEKHNSVDHYILEEAKKYGFISDIEYQKLQYIYEMRCVYGHPYQEAPSEEEVLCAISEVVDCVLSKPILFRKGYISRLVKNMIEEDLYWDNDKEKIIQYASEEMKKIAFESYGYLLDSLWKKIEPNALDGAYRKIYDRVCFFSNYIIAHSEGDIYSKDEWHQIIIKYPHTMIGVLYSISVFDIIGRLAQDTHVSMMIESLDTYPDVHKYLFEMYNFISDDNKIKYETWLNNVEWNTIQNTKINLKAIYKRLLSMFKSYNFYQQNYATIYLNNYSNQVESLSVQQQIELGRNILQAATGGADEPKRLLNKMKDMNKPQTIYGCYFVEGLLKECFINENKIIRIKGEYLSEVVKIFSNLPEESIKYIESNLLNEIKCGFWENEDGKRIGKEDLEEITETEHINKIIEEIKKRKICSCETAH